MDARQLAELIRLEQGVGALEFRLRDRHARLTAVGQGVRTLTQRAIPPSPLGTITATVLGCNTPLSGVAVTAYRSSTPVGSASTNGSGVVSFDVPAGTGFYTLVATPSSPYEANALPGLSVAAPANEGDSVSATLRLGATGTSSCFFTPSFDGAVAHSDLTIEDDFGFSDVPDVLGSPFLAGEIGVYYATETAYGPTDDWYLVFDRTNQHYGEATLLISGANLRGITLRRHRQGGTGFLTTIIGTYVSETADSITFNIPYNRPNDAFTSFGDVTITRP